MNQFTRPGAEQVACLGEAPPEVNELSFDSHRFETLAEQLELLRSLERELRGWRHWNEDLDGHWERRTNIILSEMNALMDRDVAPERTRSDLRATASVWLARWSPAPDDAAQAALAICRRLVAANGS